MSMKLYAHPFAFYCQKVLKPLIKVNNIWVKGWPWNTTVFVQWDATAMLLNGDDSYFNRGFLVITMRWVSEVPL